MKVLHVYRTYFPATQGGLEEVIRQTCKNTQDLGVESRVFCLAEQPEQEPIELPETTVFQAQQHLEISSCGISFNCIATLKRLVDWADIIQYHFPWPFADFLHFAAKVKKPCLLTYHSDIVRQRYLSMLYQPLQTRFLADMDAIVCTSPNYFATSDVLSRFQARTHVIPIGLDATLKEHTGETQETIPTIGTPYFLFVGVLRYYKGLHILLDAIKDAPFRVVIVGSGPTEKDLKAQAERLELNNVTFAGYVSDAAKAKLIQGARAIVFPSYLRSEAFGVTLLEGAMFSRALISTEVGSGTSHVNVHDQTGFVVAPGSAKSLRSAMDRLYNDKGLAERMGKAAYHRYLKFFTGEVMGKRYFQLYQKLLKREADSDTEDGVASTNSHRR